MIKVSNKLALEIIMNGENRGAGLGKIKMQDGKEVPVNFYDRYYDNTLFHLIEIEETDEFYALQNSDQVITDSPEAKLVDEAFKGLHESLDDIISILKEINKEVGE